MTHVTRLAGLALALPLLAGCGAADTSASDRVADDKPVVRTVSRQEDGDAFVAKLRTAVEQLTTTRFDVRLTGDLEASASGAADLTGDRPAVQLTPERPLLGVAEVRLVDGVGYAEVEGRWLKADVDTLLSMLPVDLPDLDLDALARTLAASVSVVDVSGDTGEEVWRATVDPARLLAGMGDGGNHMREVPAEVDVTATFTGDRLDAVVVDLGDLGGVEVMLRDQGEPVRITAPRGAQDLRDGGWFAYTPLD